ncbi:hypothetical protein [Paucibacter sp. KBW04]|uniref:hypothetical protein n=1 Tax=Paucibacter sp. KBW04 TaxID=2153361 RepID=UPI000F57D688|nr:hypothetical protein [Paucibacter sp. KBW04]
MFRMHNEFQQRKGLTPGVLAANTGESKDTSSQNRKTKDISMGEFRQAGPAGEIRAAVTEEEHTR